MKHTWIYIILLICGGTIAYILLGDLFRNEMYQSAKNPYQYELGDIKKIDPLLVKYKETRRLGLTSTSPKAIDYQNGMLVIGYENELQVIDTSGRELVNQTIEGPVTCLSFSLSNDILVGCKDHVEVFNTDGELTARWESPGTEAYFTSITELNDHIFVADAGGPVVHQYDRQGQLLHSFDGKNRSDSKHGFIIPSPYFDLDTDSEGQLWVANTGVQAIENYNSDGSLRAYWGSSSYKLSGFIGCCNPAQFTILSNDNFVTAEKGLVRVKVYLPSGELESVVATPDNFDADSEVPDLASDELDNIYLLDLTRNMIRKFERKES